MADSHDARLAEFVGELGGDDVRFLFRDLVQRAAGADRRRVVGSAR
jgi:hypothetical protein